MPSRQLALEIGLTVFLIIFAYYLMGNECEEVKLRQIAGFLCISIGSGIFAHSSHLFLSKLEGIEGKVILDFAPVILYCGAIATLTYFSPCYESILTNAFMAITLGLALIAAVFTPLYHLD